MKNEFKLKMDLQRFALSGLREPIFTQENVDAYMKVEPVGPYLGDDLFPNVDQDDNKIEIVKGGQARVPMAYVQAFDGVAHKMGREASAEKIYERMDPIKIKMSMSERLYFKYAKGLINDIFTDQMLGEVAKVYKAIKDKIEFMRMEALSTGKVVLDEATGYKRVVDLLLDDDHKAQITSDVDKWDDLENSDPIEDMLRWVEELGLEGAWALTSTKIVRLILRNKNVRREYYGDQISPHKRLTLDQLNDYLEGLGLPRIGTYDKYGWVEGKGGILTKKRFLAEDKFVILGSNPPGETQRTESVEQLKGNNIVTLEDKIAIKQWETSEPEMVWWKGAAIQFPVLSDFDNIFTATVI
ncbi:major capsid protein [Halonatronum saccharophilum]|uniref:major capsid protein n=1 Tax=Halonatronum saccharophilum TaxID=150060 RepID=UPI0004885ACF|nr:major capsid protein [Halonatronum saccharophilum]